MLAEDINSVGNAKPKSCKYNDLMNDDVRMISNVVII